VGGEERGAPFACLTSARLPLPLPPLPPATWVGRGWRAPCDSSSPCVFFCVLTSFAILLFVLFAFHSLDRLPMDEVRQTDRQMDGQTGCCCCFASLNHALTHSLRKKRVVDRTTQSIVLPLPFLQYCPYSLSVCLSACLCPGERKGKERILPCPPCDERM